MREISNKLSNLNQATPVGGLELKLGKLQRIDLPNVFIERIGNATGLVVVSAKLPRCDQWSKLAEIDLGSITEPVIIPIKVDIVSLKAQPIGVVGEFNLSYLGWIDDAITGK